MKWSMAWRSCAGEVKEAPCKRLTDQDAEPALYLIKPTGVGRDEVKMNVGVSRQPAVMLGLMGIEIVEDDVKFALWIERHNLVHEVQELPPAPALSVAGNIDLAGHDVERGKQRSGTMALVFMANSRQDAAVGQSQITLCSLQRLDVRLLIHRQHHCFSGGFR